jgi:uncharacterized protein YjeT (DUF2065 family)
MNLSLQTLTFATAGLFIAVSLPCLLAPAAWRRALAEFPRHLPSAWILTGMDLLWVSNVVLHAPLGRFEFLKPAIYILGPLSFYLLVKYLDELLAPRALGGLLLLLPNPVLNAARWHPSDARLVMTVLAYVAVVAGMLLVLAPYRFRRWTAWWIESDARCRLGGRLKLAAALVLLGLAGFVY